MYSIKQAMWAEFQFQKYLLKPTFSISYYGMHSIFGVFPCLSNKYISALSNHAISDLLSPHQWHSLLKGLAPLATAIWRGRGGGGGEGNVLAQCNNTAAVIVNSGSTKNAQVTHSSGIECTSWLRTTSP